MPVRMLVGLSPTAFFFITTFLILATIPNHALADTVISPNAYISEDTVWTKDGNPYFIQDDLTVEQNTTLFIEPGVVVQSGSSSWIDVFGRLIASGTSDEPILFTSATSDWGGIVFYNTEASSSLDNVIVRYADSISDFYSKDLSISNARVENGDLGIRAYGSHLSLNNFSAENISSDAMDISSGSDVVLKNIILKNVRSGIEVYVGSKADISNLFVDHSQNEALAAYVGSSVRIASSTITNARYAVEVFNNSSADISNLTTNEISRGDALAIFDHSEMTLNDSSIFNTNYYDAIMVANSGSLTARNVKISNSSGDGVVVFAGGSVDMRDSVISGFYYAGVADYGSSSSYPANFLSLTNNEIKNNYTGISLYSNNSSYAISNNSIHDNDSYGLDSHGTEVVDVSQNFWGDPSGPYNNPDNLFGTGDEVFYSRG